MLNFSGITRPEATEKPFFVLYSESQDQTSGGKGYWSKTFQGWTNIEKATRFSAEDRLAFTPSQGMPPDTRWRLVAQLDTVTQREVENLLFLEEIKQAA